MSRPSVLEMQQRALRDARQKIASHGARQAEQRVGASAHIRERFKPAAGAAHPAPAGVSVKAEKPTPKAHEEIVDEADAG